MQTTRVSQGARHFVLDFNRPLATLTFLNLLSLRNRFIQCSKVESCQLYKNFVGLYWFMFVDTPFITPHIFHSPRA